MSSIAHTDEDIRDDCCGHAGLKYDDVQLRINR